MQKNFQINKYITKEKSIPSLNDPDHHFWSPQLDTSQSCKTTDKGPLQHTVCILLPVFTGTH